MGLLTRGKLYWKWNFSFLVRLPIDIFPLIIIIIIYDIAAFFLRLYVHSISCNDDVNNFYGAVFVSKLFYVEMHVIVIDAFSMKK